MKKEKKPNYIQKISAKNKSPEEVERITNLFNDNINLAHNIAKKYYKTGYWNFDDSVQIARLGLWKACLIWDPSKFKLSTLATNIITRDFIDYDMKQKRQPDILFNLEQNCVTEDLTLGDVLVDAKSDSNDILSEGYDLQNTNQLILDLLNEIAEEFDIAYNYVKMVYLIFIESSQYSEISIRDIKFLPKSEVTDIINIFKNRLSEIMEV